MLTESDIQNKISQLEKKLQGTSDFNQLDQDQLQARIDFLKQELLPECRDSKDIETVYEDRNVAVLSFLSEIDIFYPHAVGWRENSKTGDDWVAVTADLPEGQVSWSIKRDDVPDWMEEVDIEYDGHSVEEKLDRLRNFSSLE